MTIAHNLGFPRIGAHRELKWAVEKYWKNEITQQELLATAKELRATHWKLQKDAGLDFVPVGDFCFYDQVLDHSAMFGVVPERFEHQEATVDLDTYFRMGRGRAPTGKPAAACEMTKWFDTNYHYIVPELHKDQSFHLATTKLFDEVEEAKALGYNPRPIVIGPLTYLWQAKSRDGSDRLTLVEDLLAVYVELLGKLKAQNVEWVQIDEPILVLDLPQAWRQAFESVYTRLAGKGPKLLLTTYFGALKDNLQLACSLPIDGLHLDLSRAPEQLDQAIDLLPANKVLSAGIVNGRNIWRNDLSASVEKLAAAHERLGDRLWIGPSCSLMHSPVDLDNETAMDSELKGWLAFAKQKLSEIQTIRIALTKGRDAVAAELTTSDAAAKSRKTSTRIHRPAVETRVAAVTEDMAHRQHPYAVRAEAQAQALKLPLFPTTTIGSFPQVQEIRGARRDFKAGRINEAEYNSAMEEQIRIAVKAQEDYGLDVLVHGEPERNDMVEYFGEQLDGFAFTANGWVQSYGSRCVKPPIIYGDVSRPHAMTVAWSKFAQSITNKPMKGMLTGPVTILQWSFVRDDQPRSATCLQIALALRDEVVDLEKAGIGVIQIDEPAFREGLPLRKSAWQEYLDWAAKCFRISASGVVDATQIHTHMCYAEFNDIIEAIADLDADVITIETTRSAMELLDAFADFEYPNEVGPGVYDIHSPNVPDTQAMVNLMRKAVERVPVKRLWVNPDCGLKTRGWPEVAQSLTNMVEAARELRQEFAS